jgi:hypothetical protein
MMMNVGSNENGCASALALKKMRGKKEVGIDKLAP